MKLKKLFTILVFMAMSFSVVHAIAIDTLDTHKCNVGEYVQEMSHSVSDIPKGDICNIHSAFHVPFIIPTRISIPNKEYVSNKPSSRVKIYKYDQYSTFLKPPITL